ncbi:MAG: radical SAM protein [Kiritimatiellae bacterium]|nr:radical SAM protein [Kiritimatiellia bacterium]
MNTPGMSASQLAPSRCQLCPRMCGADREHGAVGACGSGGVPRIYRYGPHFGEEPPVSGTRGSGTIFFSHCPLHCLYCQNYTWSQEGRGEEMGPERIAAIMESLRDKGCHNWNLVTATQWLPHVREAAGLVRGERLPFVYNTSGYERLEMLDEYSDLIDVALTDLRYSTPSLAQRTSGAADYVDAARKALLWFCLRLGPLDCDDDGIARRGVICRLLVLPGHPEEAIENLRWIAVNIGTELDISVMSQYAPVYKAMECGEFARRVTREEYNAVTDEAERLGFENGWIQPYEDDAPDSLLGADMRPGEGVVR